MVTDQEIANCVEALLRQSPMDPSLTVTTSSTSASINVGCVVQKLQATLGLDLSQKTAFIRDHISLLLHPPPPLPLPPKHHFSGHHQQQLFSGYPHQQQHQIHPPPFTNLPHQHELAFRSAPPPVQKQHKQKQQKRQKQHKKKQQKQLKSSFAAVQKQEESVGSFTTPGSSVPVRGSGQTGGKRKGGPGGLNKVCGVSPELQTIVGESTMARTQIVKQLWAYIRKNNLQDPNNKRRIICNDELRLVFETDCTDMFKMNKLLSKHIISLDPKKEPDPDSKRIKTTEEAVPLTKPDNANHPVTLSDALADFFGTEEREMLQSEAFTRIMNYIKVNQLEDPSNSVIQFDSKLQQLFGGESVSAIGLSEMLSSHLFKPSL